jgi:5'-phosphate synthase pdxT subunit
VSLSQGIAPRVGVLALQGDFDAHRKALARCGAGSREVRLPSDLAGLGALILPGGESTTMLRLIREFGFAEAIPAFVAEGGAVYGTCAGAILLARRVTSPEQWSFGLLDIEVERNGFGRQADSFEAELTGLAPALRDGAQGSPLRAVFIRAPRIRRCGPGIEVLASWNGEPVLVRGGRILVSTFHPELTDDDRIHRYFLNRVANLAAVGTAAAK